MNIQTSRLVLKTTALLSNFNNDLSKYNFNNINLRTLLGDMYDKYDLFNLSLKSIASGVGISGSTTGTELGATLNDLSISIYLSGLPFINQTYFINEDNGSYTNNNEVLLTNFIFKRNDNATLNYLNENYITFSKRQENCNLYIRYENISEPSLPSSEAAFPDMVYIFEIYGIPKENILNGSRIL